MKITIYELLGMVKDEPDRSIYVKYFDRVNKKEDVMWACKENIIYKLEQLIIELNDEVEIIETKENKIPEKLTETTLYGVPILNKKKLSNITLTNKRDIVDIKDKINEILDYLEVNNDRKGS